MKEDIPDIDLADVKGSLQLSVNWAIFFQCLIFHFPPYIIIIKNAACFTYNKFLPICS